MSLERSGKMRMWGHTAEALVSAFFLSSAQVATVIANSSGSRQIKIIAFRQPRKGYHFRKSMRHPNHVKWVAREAVAKVVHLLMGICSALLFSSTIEAAIALSSRPHPNMICTMWLLDRGRSSTRESEVVQDKTARNQSLFRNASIKAADDTGVPQFCLSHAKCLCMKVLMSVSYFKELM